MSRFLPSSDFVFGAFFGMAAFFFVLGVTSYQFDHCRQEDAGAQSNASLESSTRLDGKPALPLSEDGEREEQLTEYAKKHPSVCGVVGFPRMLVGLMDHHEGFFVGAFTLALFGATFFLWRSTDKLWAAGERQIEHVAISARFTRLAAEAAKQSADATTLIANSDRAWVTFEDYFMQSFNNTRINSIFFKETLGFSPIFVNKGRSPALYIQLNVQYRMIDANDSATPTFTASFGEEGMATMGTEKEFNGRPAVMTEAEYSNFMNKRSAAIVYCCVRYKTVSDQTQYRETHTCHRIFFPGMRIEADNVERPNWQIQAVGDQNRIT